MNFLEYIKIAHPQFDYLEKLKKFSNDFNHEKSYGVEYPLSSSYLFDTAALLSVVDFFSEKSIKVYITKSINLIFESEKDLINVIKHVIGHQYTNYKPIITPNYKVYDTFFFGDRCSNSSNFQFYVYINFVRDFLNLCEEIEKYDFYIDLNKKIIYSTSDFITMIKVRFD